MAENDDTASKLNNLFGSNLFKENNFIKIYNLLGIGNIESSEPAPPPPPSPSVTAAPIAAPLTNDIFNKIQNVSITLKDGTSSNYDIPIFSNLDISKEDKKKIIDSINNEDILKDYDDNTVILDPAGLKYMQGNVDFEKIETNNTLEYKSQNFSGGGLSGHLYENINTKIIPKEVFDFYNSKTYSNLYNDPIDVSIYNSYDSTKTGKKINIIHSLGPDFSNDIPKKYTEKYITNNTLLDLFIKIYNNILDVFTTEYKQNKNLKLRLCALSSALFSGDHRFLILQCIAYVYITLWKTHKKYISLYLLDTNKINGKNTKYEDFIESKQLTYNYIKTIIDNTDIK